MQSETPGVRPARREEVPEIAAVLEAAYAEYRDRAGIDERTGTEHSDDPRQAGG